MTFIPFKSGGGRGLLTKAFGTRIQCPIGGDRGCFTHLINFAYTSAATAHTVTVMQAASRSIVTTAVAAAGTVVVTNDKLTDGAGNDIAASDVVAFRLDDDAASNPSWHMSTVSALDSAKTSITINDAVPTGRTIPIGAPALCYGVAGDAYHSAHQYLTTVNTSKENWPATAGETVSLMKAGQRGEPLVLDANNATAAGTLAYANYGVSYL